MTTRAPSRLDPGRVCVVRSLTRTAGSAALAGVEIVEYNPYRDRGGVTARLVGDVLGALPGKPRSLQLPATAACSSNDARYAVPCTRRRAA